MSIQLLINTLLSLIELHTLLLDLAEQKTAVLVHNQVDKLNKIVNKETSLMKQMSELDYQRLEDISKFLIEKGYKPNPKVTVSELIKLVVKAEDKKSLADAHKQLLAIIDQLREKNQLNQKLIEHSLAFIDYSMDLILGPPENEVVYQNPTHQQQGIKRSGMFDSRA